MAENRVSNRIRKRLRLRYGKGRANSLAFTEDISARGLFIRTANIIQPGNVIKINLEIPESEPVVMEGMVVWAKKVPPAMMPRISKSGMGVRIMRISSNSSAYFRMHEELSARSSKLKVE